MLLCAAFQCDDDADDNHISVLTDVGSKLQPKISWRRADFDPIFQRLHSVTSKVYSANNVVTSAAQFINDHFQFIIINQSEISLSYLGQCC